MALTGDEKRRYNRRYHAKQKGEQAAAEAEADKKVLVSIRLPEVTVAMIERVREESLAGKGTFPWKEKGAAYNGLLLVGLKTIADQVDTIRDEMLPRIELEQLGQDAREHRRSLEAVLATTTDEVSRLLGIRAETEAAQLYHATMARLEAMPATVWQEHVITSLQKRFPDLQAQHARGVSLRSTRSDRKRGQQQPLPPNVTRMRGQS